MRDVSEPPLGRWVFLVEALLVVSVLSFVWIGVGGSKGVFPRGPQRELHSVNVSFAALVDSVRSDLNGNSPQQRAHNFGTTIDRTEAQLGGLGG